MWRRVYLLLVIVRLYFALSPSYIHPDEHFQGPEVIAGEIFGYPVHETWEFTSDHPIRSVFPLWVVYGIPLTIFKWIYEGLGYGSVPPITVFYGLRVLMFLLSFVLGDWAIHDLIPGLHHRRVAITLISSSYVTWTFQTHTFSNSIETLLVLWTFVFANKIRHRMEGTSFRSCCALAFTLVLGFFNRITFPAFVLLPLIQLVPSFYRKPLCIPIMLVVSALTVIVAVAMDTEYYTGSPLRLRRLRETAVLTPWNNLAYNLDEANLAEHGLHPVWQHFLANLPQLMGPGLYLMFISGAKTSMSWSALIGTAILSLFRHQEPRFLMPAVPLLLSSCRTPTRFLRPWISTWIIFNVLAGVLFGTYHQGGVIGAQRWLAEQENIHQVSWWKTYSPPRWLLGDANDRVITTDLMGTSGDRMISHITANATCVGDRQLALLVAPLSATFLDGYTQGVAGENGLTLTEVWRTRSHIGLDDLDFGDDGVLNTLRRVVGRRGLGIWRAERLC